MAANSGASHPKPWQPGLLAIVALVGTLATLLLSTGSPLGGDTARTPINIGNERLVSWETLPAINGQMCEWMPASAAEPLAVSLQEAAGTSSRTAAAEPWPGEAARSAVHQRRPLRTIKDPHFGFAGIAVDPTRNEVVVTDENQFSIVVYDRLENTPPTAAKSEPKRIISGPKTFLEFQCSVYVDPITGDIYGVNNDTVDWLVVFHRDAKGDVEPARKLATPHTTFGIAVDEQEREMFLTIQDDHAVVAFDKTANDQEPPKRTIQGPLTQMADPHGIAVDSRAGLLFVSNWGSRNERITPPEGPEKPNWPISRDHNIPGSGKFLPPAITVYRKDASGDVAPLQVIQGPKTHLDWPTALAVHPDRGELFVANDTGHSVLVFRTDANGDVAPIRVIQGPRTLIKNPVGVAVDAKNNELWVANFGNHSATVFKIDAEGNAAPLRVIRDAPLDEPAPMFGNPHVVSFDTKRKEILVAN